MFFVIVEIMFSLKTFSTVGQSIDKINKKPDGMGLTTLYTSKRSVGFHATS